MFSQAQAIISSESVGLIIDRPASCLQSFPARIAEGAHDPLHCRASFSRGSHRGLILGSVGPCGPGCLAVRAGSCRWPGGSVAVWPFGRSRCTSIALAMPATNRAGVRTEVQFRPGSGRSGSPSGGSFGGPVAQRPGLRRPRPAGSSCPGQTGLRVPFTGKTES